MPLPAPELALSGAVAVLIGPAGAAAAAPAGRWESPVAGAPLRLFHLGADPFAAGGHRGVDLAAARGTVVRAACAGRVAFAGRVASSDGVVTVACGGWRVTYLPLAPALVGRGETVARGAVLGRVGRARGHHGLHLGVRRARAPHGYVDPLPLLSGRPRPAPPGAAFSRRGPGGSLGGRPPAERRGPVAPRLADAAAATAPIAPHAPPAGALAAPERRAPAPPPAWLGLALLLAGAVGSRRRRATRRRRPRPSEEAAAAPR